MDDRFTPLADDYESWYATPLGAFVIEREGEALLAALPEPPARLLEVGAGTGWWSRILASRGYAVTAVEPSAGMRRVAAAQGGEGITWMAAAAEALPVPDGVMDIVLMTTVLEFVAEPARAVAEAWRVLRPGGSLVVGHLDARSQWTALYRHLGDRGEEPWAGARFVVGEDVASWVGSAPVTSTSCAFFGPGAEPPFDEADAAGVRAGNAGAFAVHTWRKPG